MNRWTVLYAFVLFIALLSLGCSGSGSPVTPDNGLTDRAVTSGTSTQNHLWGYWDVYIDVESQTVEAVQNRGVAFTANVTGFVNKPATNLAFVIHGTPVTAEFIDVDIDVAISHPFPGVNQYDGYDVRGIFMGMGSGTMMYDTDLAYAMYGTDDQVMYDYDLEVDPEDEENIYYEDPYEGLTGNPDGYTRWWNPTEFGPGLLGYIQGALATPGYKDSLTATLNPYKYFGDGLGVEDDLYGWLMANVADGYFVQGIFTAGTTNTRNYYLRFPIATNVKYGYAVCADWAEHEATEPAPEGSHMVEAAAVSVAYNGDVYYDPGTMAGGGNFNADINVWNWDYQPSTVTIETNVHSAIYEGAMMTGGTENYSTWHAEFAVDNVTALEGNEYWVVCEYTGFDYSAKGTDYAVEGFYPEAPLAAFFRFDLDTFEGIPCDGPMVTDLTPSGASNTGPLTGATITGTFDAGTATAKLMMAGEADIEGTNVMYVDPMTITADFDVTGAAEGFWDLVVTHADCPTAVTLDDALEIYSYTGPVNSESDALPTPLPTPNVIDLCVQDSSVFGYEGIFYSNSDGTSMDLYYYPLDYSSTGSYHCTITDPFFGDIDGLIGGPEYFEFIEVAPNGTTVFTSSDSGPGAWNERQQPVWWCGTDGLLDNGYLYYSMEFHDVERCKGDDGEIYGFWGNAPAGVDGATYRLNPPYGPYPPDYEGLPGFYIPDHVGSVDGEVSDNEAYRHAVDSEPEGLSGVNDIIMYYMEGPPDDYTIEIAAQSTTYNIPTSLATIDETDLGVTPIDITVTYCYGVTGSAAGNWLCVLEDNGDGTWDLSAWDQDGNFIGRDPAGPFDGTPLSCDADMTNNQVHVWFDDGGTLSYAIFDMV